MLTSGFGISDVGGSFLAGFWVKVQGRTGMFKKILTADEDQMRVQGTSNKKDLSQNSQVPCTNISTLELLLMKARIK